MEQNSVMVRAALGQIANVGDLYDARRDNFVGLSALKKAIPRDALKVTDNHFSDIHLIHKDTFSEKFHKLDVKAELQVSVLAGLFSLEGSGRYLKDEKTSSRSVKSTLMYKISTKDEALNVYHEDLKSGFALEAIETGVATHIVVGVTWGANSMVTCEYQNTENRNVQEIEGNLSAQLEKIKLSIRGKAEVDFNEGDNTKNINFDIRIYGDVLPQGQELPTSFEEALELMRQMPGLIKNCNEGRGKPLSYRLIPLSLLKDYLNFQLKADTLLKTLGDASILRVVQFFDQLATVRQQMNDFYTDATTHKFCIPQATIKAISSFKEEFAIQEADFRSKLASTLSLVRSGAKDMVELEDCLKEFQSGPYSPERLASTFETWGDVAEKVAFVNSIVQHGAKYIGFQCSLDDEIMKNFDAKTFVLYFNTAAKAKQQDLWQKNRQLFLQEVKKKGGQYFAVDCDIHPELWPQSGMICVQVLQNGRVLSENLVAEQEQLQSIPFAKTMMAMEKVVVKPNKRGKLSLRCPGSNCHSTKEYDWKCPNCKGPIEYGFDSLFYCECGKAPAITYDFRCADSSHGFAYEKFDNKTYLADLLARLTPFKEMNILILGETGVGKSTWINGFVNYLRFETLEEAKPHDLVTLIPGEFTVCDESYNEITVKTGEDKNESNKKGQSATQECKVYTFEAWDRIIRLIDTPGIGDTRGVDYDNKNFENILKTLSNLDALHGICILLKPNNARLTIMFRFCIKELLTYLHRDACQNIMFCFTNSRSTFYRPGDTMPALKSLLAENKDVEIPISPHTVFCYDSEAYRFLAATKSAVNFTDDEEKNFSESWKKSISETQRMLKHIDGISPHAIKSTLSLNHARNLVDKLSRPLAEINKVILTNKSILTDQLKAIENDANYIKNLEKQRMTSKVELETHSLDYPRTVCTHDSCKQIYGKGDEMKIKYTTVCHDNCQLTEVTRDTIGHHGLMRCWALHQDPSSCRVCSHEYQIHLHIYYESEEVKKQVEDETVKQLLQSKLSDAEKKKALIDAKKREIAEYNDEQMQIEKASAYFAHFLKNNAITPYNDAMLEYMDHLIKEERAKVVYGGLKVTLEQLEKSKASYERQIKLLEAEMAKGGGGPGSQSLRPGDIDVLVKNLYKLKHNGKDIQQALKAIDHTQMQSYTYREVHAPHQPSKTQAIVGFFRKLWSR